MAWNLKALKLCELPKEENPAVAYLQTVRGGSQRTLIGALNNMAAILTNGRGTHLSCPWHLLRGRHTSAIKYELEKRYKAANVNKHLSALRGVLKTARLMRLMTERQYEEATDFKSVSVTELPQARVLSREEVKELFRTCSEDESPTGIRDSAILSILYGCGLRRKELSCLDTNHYDQEEGAIAVPGGHGGIDRIAYPPEGTRKALGAWLEARGGEPGALFIRVRKGGNLVPDSRLTDQAVMLIVKKRAEMAALGHVVPQDLRRCFINDLLELGASVPAVQRLAGHTLAQSTLRYDRTHEVGKREAAQKLMVPYGVAL